MICLKPCPLGKWVWKKILSKKIYLSWTNGQEVFRRMHEVPKPIHEPISLVHREPTNWPNWCIVKVKQASQILLAQIFLEHQFLLFYWQFSCKRNHFPVFEIHLGEIMSQQDLWIQGNFISIRTAQLSLRVDRDLIREGGVPPYTGYILSMCGSEGYGFQVGSHLVNSVWESAGLLSKRSQV